VSQSTQSQGVDKGRLSVAQTQTASLSSQYTKSRDGADPAKGDYDIYRVNDSTSTTTAFEYARNKLKSASITSVVSQLDQYEKLVGYKVVDKKDTPTNRSTGYLGGVAGSDSINVAAVWYFFGANASSAASGKA
jgi:hypothetical protein